MNRIAELTRTPISISSNGAWATTNCLSCCGMFDFKYSQRNKYPNAGSFCSRECANRGSLRQCLVCNEWFRSYNNVNKYCKKHVGKAYMNLEGVERKAFSLGGSLRLGKNKRQMIIKLLNEAIAKPCKYCSILIDLDNASIDHKEPFSDSGLNRKGGENYTLRSYMDRIENLQVICRNCNQLKGDMSDIQYSKLVTFLETDPGLHQKVMRRLSHTKSMWGYRRNAK